jgi:hypothetical protein
MNKIEKQNRIAEIKAILSKNKTANELKHRGDLHIQNVFRFFGKWVEKSDPLRDTVKAVIFG